MWAFLLISTLAWGIAEIFYKKGNCADEKYSHLKTTVFVGFFMGIYALIILFTQGIDLKTFPSYFVRYLPIAICYIVSMVCSYFGVRFVEESISDPIENTSGAIVPILCAIFLKETFSRLQVIGIIVVFIGLVCVGLLDKKGNNDRKQKFGKKLAIWAISMPFCYLFLDSVGTFLDIYYVQTLSDSILLNSTERVAEHTANCAYELTFFIVAVVLFIFLKIKKQSLFSISKGTRDNNLLSAVVSQKWKILAAVFETIGQATYLFALSEGTGIAAVIIGAGTVIVSLILSRLILKEKLSINQYIFVAIILIGIVILSLS